MGVRIGPAALPAYYGADRHAREAALGRSPWLELVAKGYLWETSDVERIGSCEEAALAILEEVEARTRRTRAGRWAFDVTVDVPKTISLAWAIGSAEVSRAVEAAHEEAADAVIAAIGRLPLCVRLSGGGRIRAPGDPIIFRARHVVARPAEIAGLGLLAAPHLHQQIVVPALARRPDFGLSALDYAPLFRARFSLESVHARVLSKALVRYGLPVREHPRHGLAIDFVPDALVELGSARRHSLCALAAALDLPLQSQDLRLADAIRHRLPKADAPLAEILDVWRGVARALAARLGELDLPRIEIGPQSHGEADRVATSSDHENEEDGNAPTGPVPW